MDKDAFNGVDRLIELVDLEGILLFWQNIFLFEMTLFHLQLDDEFALFKNLKTWNLHFFYKNMSFIF